MACTQPTCSDAGAWFVVAGAGGDLPTYQAPPERLGPYCKYHAQLIHEALRVIEDAEAPDPLDSERQAAAQRDLGP